MECEHCGRTIQCKCYTWFVRSCVLGAVTALIGLVCCVYCTYMVITLQADIRTCSDDHQQNLLVPEENHELVSLQIDEWSKETPLKQVINKRSKRQANEPRKPKSQKKEKNKNKAKDKKRKGRGERKKKTLAAHYILRKGLDDYVANCPPGSKPARPVKGTTIDVFEVAPFVTDKTNPFLMLDGKFIAGKTGLYLVYAQIRFEDCKKQGVMRVVQSRRVNSTVIIIQEQSCFVGISPTASRANNTCSVTSLFYLVKNDYITVENHYPEVHINYRSNSTFFGAVYIR